MIDILKDKNISKYNLKLAVPIALKEYDETSLVPDAYAFGRIIFVKEDIK